MKKDKNSIQHGKITVKEIKNYDMEITFVKGTYDMKDILKQLIENRIKEQHEY